MLQAFNRLLAEMDHLVGEVKGSGVCCPPLASDVVRLLRNQRQLSFLVQCTALDRARSRLAASGPHKANSWYRLGEVEKLVGRSLGAAVHKHSGCGQLIMLPDADRQSVHNEQLRLELLAERALQDAAIDTLRTPMAAMTARLYTVGCVWMHDRCRDAMVWHAMSSEEHGLLVPDVPGRVVPFAKDYGLDFLQVFAARSLERFQRTALRPEISRGTAHWSVACQHRRHTSASSQPLVSQHSARRYIGSM